MRSSLRCLQVIGQSTLLSAPELISRPMDDVHAENITVNRAVFEKMSYRENPDGWLAVFPIPHLSLDDLKLSKTPLVILAESIEKPGNLGAILRTADAAHVDALLVSDPRVDVWNPTRYVRAGEQCSACRWLNAIIRPRWRG